MLCIGHRGARGSEPENTVRAVRAALAMGAHGVEIDVQALEGELVVLHDATLNRTTNGRGRLSRHRLGYVRALDAGGGERVPLLREVLDAVDRRAFVNIELKGRGTALLAEAVVREYIAERGWAPEQFLVSSFHRAELRKLRDTGLRLGVLFAHSARRFRPLARALQAWSIHPPLRHVNGRLVQRAHAEGLRVFVYTVNEAREVERLRAMGVDGIFTDFPGRFTELPGDAAPALR